MSGTNGSNGAGAISRLRKAYDLSNEAVPIPFSGTGGDVTILLRRAEYRDPTNGHQPYQDHMRRFHENFRKGGKRRQEPNDNDIKAAQREGVCKYLFGGGDLSAEEFKAVLYDESMPEFLDDVFFAISRSEYFRVERQPGVTATEENAGNSSPA